MMIGATVRTRILGAALAALALGGSAAAGRLVALRAESGGLGGLLSGRRGPR